MAYRLAEDGARRVLAASRRAGRRATRMQIPAAFSQPVQDRATTGTTRRSSRSTCDGRRMEWPRGRMLGAPRRSTPALHPRQPPRLRHLAGRARLHRLGLRRAAALLHARTRTTPAAPRTTTRRAGRCASRTSAHPELSAKAFVESAAAHGIPRNDDFNGAVQDGAGLFQVTQQRGRRWSAADAYLRPAMERAGLEVRHARARDARADRGRSSGRRRVRRGRPRQRRRRRG